LKGKRVRGVSLPFLAINGRNKTKLHFIARAVSIRNLSLKERVNPTILNKKAQDSTFYGICKKRVAFTIEIKE